jgi:hypothetical protein
MPEWSLAALRNLLPQMSGANFGTTSPQEDADMPLTGLDRAVAGIGQGLAKTVTTPGTLMAPNPYPEGSESWYWYNDQKDKAAVDWGRDTAMQMAGPGLAVGAPVKAGETVLGAGPIRAYHSSPHDFDKFDLSKIGTGEGAQVYGHGLYFAENPAVSGQGGQYWNQFRPRFDMQERNAAAILQMNKFDRNAAIEHLQEMIGKQNDGLKGWSDSQRAMSTGQREISAMEKQIELLQSDKPVGPRTYEVNINADPAHFLDWDKPFTSPDAMEAFASKFDTVNPTTRRFLEDYSYANQKAGRPLPDGEDIFHELKALSSPKQFSQEFSEAGIPGIKYLDEGSRNARPVLKTDRSGNVISSEYAPPTSNYVVFNPGIVDIMKKYGLAGLAPAGAAAYGAAQQDQQQF